MGNTHNKIQLPNDVVSPTDVFRLIREVGMIDDFFRQASIRSAGAKQVPPRYSRLLDAIVTLNNMNLLHETERAHLVTELQNLADSSPVIHMSFSVDPPGAYVQKIVGWLRENLQSDILLRIGLQPNIGAGCVIRTTNHAYDFSLRKYFDVQREYFGKKLHEAVSEENKEFSDSIDPHILSQSPIDQINVATAKAPKVSKTVSAKEAGK